MMMISVKAVSPAGDSFKFPENTELVSLLYVISSSPKPLELDPVKIEIEHCVKLEKEDDCDYLCFGIAKCDRASATYMEFEILEGGTFSPHSQFGEIYGKSLGHHALGSFIIGIFKYTDHLPTFQPEPQSVSHSSSSQAGLCSGFSF